MTIVWKTRWGRAFFALSLAPAAPASAAQKPAASEGRTQDGRAGDARLEFATQGTIELGGSVALESSGRLFEMALTPIAGYFIRDAIEVSAQLRLNFQSRKEDDDSRADSGSGMLVIEPSYHLPFQEKLFPFAGLGLGVGHDGDDFLLGFMPRLGVKILVGENGLLTPALRIPILVAAPDTGIGFGIEAGYSVAW
jgi:hypothetical protein